VEIERASQPNLACFLVEYFVVDSDEVRRVPAHSPRTCLGGIEERGEGITGFPLVSEVLECARCGGLTIGREGGGAREDVAEPCKGMSPVLFEAAERWALAGVIRGMGMCDIV
jgi:hypothetical protein